MNGVHQGMITLLKSAVTGEKYALPEGFDIDAAYQQTMEQQIGALIYDGALLCGVDPNGQTMQRLFQNYCKILQISERQQKAAERIFAAFEQEQIDYMPLKGCVMKKLYPKHELRMMGDADILIRVEQYAKIIPIMENLGFRMADETAHDYGWHSDALQVELHKYPLPPNQPDLFAYFEDGWKFAKRESGSRFAMSDEDTLVFLFAHFAKHYRGCGIGCRHMVDLWVFLQANPALNMQYVREKLEEMHLWVFYGYIIRTLQVWFENGSADEMTEHITEVIFANGCWGMQSNVMGYWSMHKRAGTGKTASIRLAYALEHLFPGMEEMAWQYPVLKKAPVLLPVMWLWRMAQKLLCSTEPMRRQMKMISSISKESVEIRREMMKYVGLDEGK